MPVLAQCRRDARTFRIAPDVGAWSTAAVIAIPSDGANIGRPLTPRLLRSFASSPVRKEERAVTLGAEKDSRPAIFWLPGAWVSFRLNEPKAAAEARSRFGEAGLAGRDAGGAAVVLAEERSCGPCSIPIRSTSGSRGSPRRDEHRTLDVETDAWLDAVIGEPEGGAEAADLDR